MFQDLRPGNRPVLVDVTDDEDCDPGGFGKLHQCHRAVLDLGDRAGRRIVIGAGHGLNGVYDQNIGLRLLYGCQDRIHLSLSKEQKVFRQDAEALSPHF